MDEQWVVDASVVAKIYLRDEDHADLAEQLIGRYVAGTASIIAPQFILYEVPSTILGAVRGRRIDPAEATSAIHEFFNLAIPTVGDDATLQPMIRAATALAAGVGCTLYDALYLAVAREFDRPLITADSRLHRTVASTQDKVVLLGEYASLDEGTTHEG